MQPQGHAQVVLRLVDHGDDPRLRSTRGGASRREARCISSRVRWRFEERLAALGHDVRAGEPGLGDSWIAGSDARGDGVAVGV